MTGHLANFAIGESACDHHQRQEPEEHPAPADVLADERGERRSGDARDDPRGREDREHPRPQRFGEGAADHDVSGRRDGARAETLNRTRRNQYWHRWREPAREKPDDEQQEAEAERHRGSVTVGELPGDDDAGEIREQERAEDPAVKRQPRKILGNQRHDRRYSERLEPDERHVEDEPDRQSAPARVEKSGIHLNG